MIAYYELTKGLYDHLIADEYVSTCVIGSLDEVDINKQTLFPLVHIFVGGANVKGGYITFDVTITSMDLTDIQKGDTTTDWRGQDNTQDMLNSMLTVHENLNRALDKGTFQDSGWILEGDYSCEPFEDRFENLLTGWSANLTILIPNTIQNCIVPDPVYAVKCISANNEYMSSPSANYLPSDFLDMYIKCEFSNCTSLSRLVQQGYIANENIGISLLYDPNTGLITFTLRDGTTINALQYTDVSLPSSGIIEVKKNPNLNELALYFNDVLVDSEEITLSGNTSGLSAFDLYFNAGVASSFSPIIITFGNVVYNYIKINNNEWTFSEGSGSTTTSSEGTVTTLNSDVSTEAMWVEV